ncbi:TonB family C-terminal domain-containing protein [Algoriphagus alkaliphilus]|uniref:TonB family C-terminal domain-containing protein n=2 Tax=Algoriphagus TaxID=246875 RepID=A0A1G5Z973_9BACT|nr:M56 family metallopeptidase [Algoriphagus alkaliphilus]SDA91324.1 TonB family C-terminal domain-containing protein [Algoriphagus alkaliphilus]
MNALLIYLVEVSICLGISLVIYRVLLSGLTFFSWNRSILLGLLILSGFIPLLRLEFFDLGPEITEMTLPVFQVGDQVAEVGSRWFSWSQLLIGVYLVGVVFTAARLIFGFMVSQRQIGNAKKIYYNKHYIAIHPEFVPASFFDYILMPDFDPENTEQKQIILHESMHVRLRHSWDLLLVNFAKVFFWFNPLIYLFENSLREVHEYQADQGVTFSYGPKEYATLLLKLITAKPGWQFMNNFNQFQTKKRIIMLGKSQSAHWQKLRFLTLIPVIGLLVLVFSCERQDLEPQLSTLIDFDQVIEVPDDVQNLEELSLENPVYKPLVADQIFDVVEQQPNPPGGMSGWNQYLAKNLQYPFQARRMGIEGTVIVVFVIKTDGSIHDVEILRGIGGGADEEAMRVVQNAPRWEPGRQRGKLVNTRMRLPIRFKLASSTNSASETAKLTEKNIPTQVVQLQEIQVTAYLDQFLPYKQLMESEFIGKLPTDF